MLIATQSTWPSFYSQGGKSKGATSSPYRAPLLDSGKFNGPQVHIQRIVPVTWCEEIQQKEFWNVCVR